MKKTVTFSFSSTQYQGTEATETFSLEELGIREKLDDKALNEILNKIFQAWVWDKLNISHSIVINDDKS